MKLKVLCLVFAFLGCCALASCQSSPPAQELTVVPDSSKQVGYPEEEVDTFARAILKVDEVNQSYQRNLDRNKPEPEQIEKLQSDATLAMVKAVESQGMDIDTYNQMQEAARDNPTFSEKVQSRIQSLLQSENVQVPLK